MKKLIFITSILLACQWTARAQDPRERHYLYEILNPSHEPKPRVEGFAARRVEEPLDRGVVAVPTADGTGVYVSWRLLRSDNPAAGFNVIRQVNGKEKRLNSRPITATCDFIDPAPMQGAGAVYRVVPAARRDAAMTGGEARVNKENYTTIKLKDPTTRAGKVAIADLNGDGVYDFVARTPSSNVDPGMPGDTVGTTYKIEAYLHDGTHLWTKDLGTGIEPGIWYSPFIVFDFNGDGKAEVALKTAPDNVQRNTLGRVDWGDEYLSVLDGMTGDEIARVDWPERNARYGNLIRRNRNQIGMAYLDGKTPYILAARGTYKAMVVDAWQLNGTRLERAWRWDGDEENPVVRSQGAHSMQVGDVDGDGRDEILLGSCMIDDDGTLLWSSGLGHPDKAILTDVDPERPGLEVLLGLEAWHDNGRGVSLHDARTGETIWGIGHKTFHVGDAMATDFDPDHPGLECFAAEDRKGGSTDRYLLTSKGTRIGSNDEVPPCRNWAWWDADLLRETFAGDNPEAGAPARNGRPQKLIKWKGKETVARGIHGDILMIVDLEGDWREEIITCVRGELRVYHTQIPAKDRRVSLIQDPIYRLCIAHRSMGYPQSPVPGFYLGE
jgi:rhamnogalacturonan endolyase